MIYKALITANNIAEKAEISPRFETVWTRKKEEDVLI